ncbi:MAG: hypothetical protein ACJ74H_10685 [Thermoanaerobaculia bacterium]
MVTAAAAAADAAVTENAAIIREAAAVIARTICANSTVCDQLIALLAACGRVRVDSGDARPLQVVGAAMARFVTVTEEVICATLAYSIQDDEQHLEEIRRLFLRPQETYSVDELATLWRIHPDDVRDIYHDELLRRVSSTEEGAEVRIAWADAVTASVTFNILRPSDVERALGAEFSRVRPAAWRTVPVLVLVPRFIAEAIANEHSIPPTLPVDVRLEQIILEVFASDEYSISPPPPTVAG